MKFVLLHGLGQTAQDWQAVIHQSSLSNVDCPELFSFAENDFTYSGILSGLERFYANASEPFVLCGLSKHDTIKLSHSMRMLDFSPKLSEIHCPVSVICGKKDRANLKAAKQLHALLPQSHLHIIPGAGHEVNKDAPKALAALIENCI